MHEVAAIILAAGLSRRMGADNKLLLAINGVPMIRHVVTQYRAAIDGPITVVTGHEAPLVEAALAGLEVTCVRNADFAAGQPGSVAFGLTHCPSAQAILIGLGDQPFLRADDITALLSAHDQHQQATGVAKISVPMQGDQRGNPIVVPHALRPQLTADPARPGCMRFTRDNPEQVQQIGLPNDGFYRDVDTPQAYAELRQMEESLS